MTRSRRPATGSKRHRDKYARLVPGDGDRSCRKSDGSPKRKYPDEASADVARLRAAEVGKSLHVYRCPVCECWHLATTREDQP